MPSPELLAKAGDYSFSSPSKKEKEIAEGVEITEVTNEFHESFSVLKAWSDALVASDAEKVLELYTGNAVLWPTLSSKIRMSKEQMRPYFDMFVQKVTGDVAWKGAAVQELGDGSSVVWSGLYGFPTKDGEVEARFTYVLSKVEGSWKIVTHHSSLPPEQ